MIITKSSDVCGMSFGHTRVTQPRSANTEVEINLEWVAASRSPEEPGVA